MGLTIHYQLQSDTRTAKEARRLVGKLRKKALDLPFAEVGEVSGAEGRRLRLPDVRRERPLALARHPGGAVCRT